MSKLKCYTFRIHSLLLIISITLSFVVPNLSVAQTFASSSSSTSPVIIRMNDTTEVVQKAPSYFIKLIDTNEVVAAPIVVLNAQAKLFVTQYLKRSDEELREIKKRSASHFNTIERILNQHQLPVELKYLAVIESQLRTGAVSHAGAGGMWQLMPQTARYLGLKVSAKNDERNNIVKSTMAAAKYIKQLQAQFDDWLLVIAAYNSGAGTVSKAMKKAGSRDFWKLQHYLPAETRGHVKRFIGAHYFFENKGSLITLTQTEKLKHLKAVAEYIDAKKVIEELTAPAGQIIVAVIH